MKKNKMISAVITALIGLLAAFPASVQAAGQTGEICVQLTENNGETGAEGVRFYCTKAAAVKNGEIILAKQFEDSGVDINRIETSDELRTAAEKLAEYEEEGLSGVTDGNGKVNFENLEEGVYLIRAEEDPRFDMIVPCLVMIPGQEPDGTPAYLVVVEPKHVPREPEEDIPKTGDEEEAILYWTGAMTALAVITVVLRKWGKNRKEK